MRLPGLLIETLTVSGTMTGADGGLSRGPGSMDVLPYDIIEFYPDPTLVIDNKGMVIAWNKAMEDMTGVRAKEVIGKGDYEYSLAFYGCRRPILIDLLDFPVDRVKAMYSEVRIADGKLEAMTESVRLKGSEVVLWCISSKLYGHDGKAVGAIESIRDVTGQVRTERELKKARIELEMRVEERTSELARARSILQATLDTIPVGVVMADASNGLISYATKSAVDIFGSEMVGIDICGNARSFWLRKSDGSPLAPDERPLYRSLFYGERISAEEIQVMRADGSIVTTLVSSVPVRDEEEAIAAAVVCIMDITERKLAEDALRESEEKFRALAETMASAVFIYQDDKLQYVNPALEEITGYDKDELLEMRYWDFMHPDCQEMVKERGRARISGEPVPSHYEVKIITRSGDDRWLDIAAALIEYNGRPAGLMTAFDITERKKAKDALVEAKQQAELYLDLMGHDINNMNQIALGYLELAEETRDEKAASVVSKALEMLKSSSALISNLRKIQRIKGGAIELERINLGELLSEVRDEYSMMPGRPVSIANDPCSDCVVMANPLLKDVFSNIVSNAIKHSEGSVEIGIKVEKVNARGSECYKVSVEDNGPGIPDEFKEKIFNRFTRGKTEARGHGLGLYLVRTLVEGFRGRVWVEDRVKGDCSHGCRFVVLLPAAED